MPATLKKNRFAGPGGPTSYFTTFSVMSHDHSRVSDFDTTTVDPVCYVALAAWECMECKQGRLENENGHEVKMSVLIPKCA